MRLIFGVGVYLLILAYKSTESTTLTCNFYIGDFSHSIDASYYCSVYNLKMESKEAAIIDGINGTHEVGHSNNDIVAFQIYVAYLACFPQNLDKYFKNLKAIALRSCRLKEIHQHDLKPFPNLVDLYLNDNYIQVLEEGLFDYNQNLVYIRFSGNEIVQIHPKIFQNLEHLTHVNLTDNACISTSAETPSQVHELIQQISSKCQNSAYLYIESKLKILESSSKSLTPSSLKLQLDDLQTEIRRSDFSELPSFKDRIEVLKVTTVVGFESKIWR
ncbi:leucine-rich repeat-containing protein 69-like [Chironomus tepperi]|uniref:leucine-rich repeat-containing protein 69-like n=1 Tax=Chironomus tepperi TaxID=113505 RepID=UPI00391F7BAB